MKAEAIEFKGHPCFKRDWSGFGKIKPLTLIIGKNNSGKSHLLHFVKELCDRSLAEIKWDLRVEASLSKDALLQVFRENVFSPELQWLGGSDWVDHGSGFEGKNAIWTRERDTGENVVVVGCDFSDGGVPPRIASARKTKVRSLFSQLSHPFRGKSFKHLLADRDIQPEPMSNTLQLSPNGFGATNIVRKFLFSTEPAYSRDVIQKDVLNALNQIFGDIGKFREITVQHHDGRVYSAGNRLTLGRSGEGRFGYAAEEMVESIIFVAGGMSLRPSSKTWSGVFPFMPRPW